MNESGAAGDYSGGSSGDEYDEYDKDDNWWDNLPGIGNGIGEFMASQNWKNPGDAANKYLDQVPGAMNPYYQPYINAGNQAIPQLEGQYGNLLNNPGQFINSVGANYKQSPGYDWQVGQATNAANRASAAGGMLGSPQEQQQLATNVAGIANQDYYNYLNHAMGAYGMGLHGEEGLAGMGQKAGDEYGSAVGQNLTNQAKNAYNSTSAENQNQAGGWGGLWNAVGGIAKDFFIS